MKENRKGTNFLSPYVNQRFLMPYLRKQSPLSSMVCSCWLPALQPHAADSGCAGRSRDCTAGREGPSVGRAQAQWSLAGAATHHHRCLAPEASGSERGQEEGVRFKGSSSQPGES